ncbi:MAG: hypothetical protein P8L85_01600 [Rubripirellula sp.]|nr:hypothetical protein [Rubripirellula sp.]
MRDIASFDLVADQTLYGLTDTVNNSKITIVQIASVIECNETHRTLHEG